MEINNYHKTTVIDNLLNTKQSFKEHLNILDKNNTISLNNKQILDFIINDKPKNIHNINIVNLNENKYYDILPLDYSIFKINDIIDTTENNLLFRYKCNFEYTNNFTLISSNNVDIDSNVFKYSAKNIIYISKLHIYFKIINLENTILKITIRIIKENISRDIIIKHKNSKNILNKNFDKIKYINYLFKNKTIQNYIEDKKNVKFINKNFIKYNLNNINKSQQKKSSSNTIIINKKILKNSILKSKKEHIIYKINLKNNKKEIINSEISNIFEQLKIIMCKNIIVKTVKLYKFLNILFENYYLPNKLNKFNQDILKNRRSTLITKLSKYNNNNFIVKAIGKNISYHKLIIIFTHNIIIKNRYSLVKKLLIDFFYNYYISINLNYYILNYRLQIIKIIKRFNYFIKIRKEKANLLYNHIYNAYKKFIEFEGNSKIDILYVKLTNYYNHIFKEYDLMKFCLYIYDLKLLNKLKKCDYKSINISFYKNIYNKNNKIFNKILKTKINPENNSMIYLERFKNYLTSLNKPEINYIFRLTSYSASNLDVVLPDYSFRKMLKFNNINILEDYLDVEKIYFFVLKIIKILKLKVKM